MIPEGRSKLVERIRTYISDYGLQRTEFTSLCRVTDSMRKADKLVKKIRSSRRITFNQAEVLREIGENFVLYNTAGKAFLDEYREEFIRIHEEISKLYGSCDIDGFFIKKERAHCERLAALKEGCNVFPYFFKGLISSFKFLKSRFKYKGVEIDKTLERKVGKLSTKYWLMFGDVVKSRV